MKIHQKFFPKRYYIYAKRKDGKLWSEWTQVDELGLALEQVDKVRELGFLAKCVDKKTLEIICEDK